jgi:hypothetical protein
VASKAVSFRHEATASLTQSFVYPLGPEPMLAGLFLLSGGGDTDKSRNGEAEPALIDVFSYRRSLSRL